MKFINGSVYLEKSKTLVISDIHLGLIESITKKGTLLPINHNLEVLKKIATTIAIIKKQTKEIKTIIFNGDIIHEFHTLPQKILDEINNFLNALSKYKLIFIKGNHDNILKPFFNNKKLELKDYIIIKNTLITHGHKKITSLPKAKKIKRIIIGHQHCAITLKNALRSEKYKCYIVGHHYNKEIIAMPSFHDTTIGTNILQEEIISPYLPKNINKFNIFIISDKIYNFGQVESLQK